MTKRYRGDNRLAQIQPEKASGYSLCLKMDPYDVHLFLALMEGYAHLAFPVGINPKKGRILLHTTPDFLPDLQKILEHSPMKLVTSTGQY